MSDYKKYIDVTVHHGYFNSGPCTALRFEPNEETIRVIARFGMVFQPKANGFSLFTSKKFDFSYLKDTLEFTHFEFEMRQTDSNFLAYTDFDPDWNGFISYSVVEQALVPEYETEKRALLGNAILGSVTIGVDQGGTYEITFQARSTVWDYYIINQSSLDLDSSVITTKSGDQFPEPIPAHTISDLETLLFSSGDQLYPLTQKPEQFFQLRVGSKVLFKALPVPIVDNFEIESVDSTNKRVRSPMLVYV